MLKNTDFQAEGQISSNRQIHDFAQAKAYLFEKISAIYEPYLSGKNIETTPKIIRIEAAVPRIDPLSWLQRQNIEQKTFWEDRENSFVMAGVGEADVQQAGPLERLEPLFTQMRHNLDERYRHTRYYGGLRFYEPCEGDSSWQAFGNVRFILPRFEIYRTENRTVFAANVYLDAGKNLYRQRQVFLGQLEKINFSKSVDTTRMPSLVSRQDLPDQSLWKRSIQRALKAFASGAMQKVVLARKSVFSFEDTLDGLLLLRRLKASNPKLFYFAFQPDAQHCFIGGSPERLYKRAGQQIKSEAIAGTRPRGQSLEEDKRLGQELINSDKDLREHHFVLESIQKTLQRFCYTIDYDVEISLLKLSRLQHLCCRLQGILADHVTDAQILRALHPTPAVGGFPTEKAVQAIRELEPFDRGWYAGPVGWVGANAAEFVVAIRSGLIHKNQLSLFSGAGIVEGSTPEGEWQEIENKIANFMKVLSTPC